MYLLHHKGSEPERVSEQDAKLLIGNNRGPKCVATLMESLKAGVRVQINEGNYLEFRHD